LRRGGAIGVFLRYVFEAGAFANFCEETFSLGLRGGQRLGVVSGRSSGRSVRVLLRLSRRLLRGNQNFAELDLLRMLHLGFMLVVELLLFFLANRKM